MTADGLNIVAVSVPVVLVLVVCLLVVCAIVIIIILYQRAKHHHHQQDTIKWVGMHWIKLLRFTQSELVFVLCLNEYSCSLCYYSYHRGINNEIYDIPNTAETYMYGGPSTVDQHIMMRYQHMIVMGSTTTPIMREPLLITAYQMYLRKNRSLLRHKILVMEEWSIGLWLKDSKKTTVKTTAKNRKHDSVITIPIIQRQ